MWTGHKRIYAVHIRTNGDLLLGTTEGLFRHNTVTKTLVRVIKRFKWPVRCIAENSHIVYFLAVRVNNVEVNQLIEGEDGGKVQTLFKFRSSGIFSLTVSPTVILTLKSELKMIKYSFQSQKREEFKRALPKQTAALHIVSETFVLLVTARDYLASERKKSDDYDDDVQSDLIKCRLTESDFKTSWICKLGPDGGTSVFTDFNDLIYVGSHCRKTITIVSPTGS